MPSWKSASLILASSPGDHKSMHDWLAAQAAVRPHGLALICGPITWTYQELHNRVDHMAARLHVVGVRPGAYIALLLPNCAETVLALYATLRLGAVPVLLQTRLTSSELTTLLGTVTCDLLLCIDETAALASELSHAVPLLVSLDHTDDPRITPLLRVAPSAANPSYVNTFQPDDPCAILFTSGTSGNPKGVILSFNNIFSSAMASAYRIGTLPDDRWLCVLPLYHVGGLSILLRACLYGTTVDLWPRFDAEAIAIALEHTPVTLISLVPTMLYRVMEAWGASFCPQALRLVLLGGAAADEDLVTRAWQAGLPIATTYGMTEAASQVATALPSDTRHKPGSVGKPLLFTSLRIIDKNSNDCPVGTYGEIIVKGPTVMVGYVGHTSALRNGWLHTGDIGYLDDSGDLWVVQRRSDLIISGGENIYPIEIEHVLRQHPAVVDVAVVGIDSPEWGQQVGVVLVLRDRTLSSDDILTFSRTCLAGYKQPRIVRLVDEIPRSASGKLLRGEVRRLLAE